MDGKTSRKMLKGRDGEEVELIRSRRKTISLEITRDARVIVRAPDGMLDEEILHFLDRKWGWLERNRAKIKAEMERQTRKKQLTKQEIGLLKEQAQKVIPVRTAYYAAQIGVTYGKITIRHQKTRWGSCSSKGNLNFNCELMRFPEEIVDYVIVHELCHRLEMNHSRRFWAEVEKILPDYRERRKWLKEQTQGSNG